jgi:DNA-binding NarL/FixJ family response regulator
MDKPNVSLIADALLACIERDADAPHYREDRFRRKLQDAHERELRLPIPPCGAEAREILRHQWDEVTQAANLTERQLEVVRMRLDGYTFEQIGQLRGASKQGAQNVFFQAAKKLVKAWLEYPYRGLDDVYRGEVQRALPPNAPERRTRTP